MSDAMQVDVSVQMKEALGKLDKSTVERLVTEALVSGGLLIANQAKDNAAWKTGSMRRSIHVAGNAKKTDDFDPAGDLEKYNVKYSEMEAPGSLRAIIGTNITDPPYPAFIEFGTSKMPARPFLGPAMDSERDAVLKEVGEALGELIAHKLGSL